jgi:ribosomal RNA-processing protein 12
LITFLPLSDLHFIPCILPEVVLACKDANEKARQAGFELIIHLANKIKNSPAGTVIQNGKVPHLSSNALAAQASLEEVFTMVSAGLAGVAPHMIAASIAALSCLLFEFHAELPRVVLDDLINTIQMFLQSNNREIVRSVLGFVKVAVVVAPDEVMGGRMPELVTGMMVWSKENKGRLRAKVKGILDRCIRKFGAELVEKWVGEKERKMVVNLRKARERSKRKKKGDANSKEIGDEAVGRREFDNKLDEVLGSDSDDSVISSDEESGQSMGLTSKSKKHTAQFLRDDGGDEPVDLLGSSALANVSSTRAVRFKDSAAPARRKSNAKVNEDGKLIFNGNDADWGDELSANTAMNAGNAVNAYAEAVSGEGALHVGQKGRLKAKQQRAGVEGEKMDLDEDEARQVAKSILQGRKRSKLPERRGLGVQKARFKDSSKGRTGVGTVQTHKGKFRGNRGKFRPKHGGRRL